MGYNEECITRDETNYALGKQIHSGVSLATNYGDIRLTNYEYEKLEKFLTKLLEGRDNRLKDDEEYNS
jgi:hypothetical protein